MISKRAILPPSSHLFRFASTFQAVKYSVDHEHPTSSSHLTSCPAIGIIQKNT